LKSKRDNEERNKINESYYGRECKTLGMKVEINSWSNSGGSWKRGIDEESQSGESGVGKESEEQECKTLKFELKVKGLFGIGVSGWVQW